MSSGVSGPPTSYTLSQVTPPWLIRLQWHWLDPLSPDPEPYRCFPPSESAKGHPSTVTPLLHPLHWRRCLPPAQEVQIRQSPRTRRDQWKTSENLLNTIQRHLVISKLHSLHLPPPLIHFIDNFLTDRPQAVRLGSTTSPFIIKNTGVPQDCVLSPFL